MKRKYNVILFFFIFFVTLIIVFCLGYFRENISSASGRFNLEFTSAQKIIKVDTAVYDIQNENLSKSTSMADIISISVGQGSRVINMDSHPIWLSARVSGLNVPAKILSTNPIFDGIKECCVKPIKPGEVLDIYIDFDLPLKVLDNYIVCKGKIEFLDFKNGKKLGEIPLKIINSKPRKSCCKMVPIN